MTEEKLYEIFDEIDSKWTGDNCFKGLQILDKYSNGDVVVCGAAHDMVYSMDVISAIENGLTEEDAEKLAKLNWIIDDGYFQCFV